MLVVIILTEVRENDVRKILLLKEWRIWEEGLRWDLDFWCKEKIFFYWERSEEVEFGF